MDKEAILKLSENGVKAFKFIPAAKDGLGIASSFLRRTANKGAKTKKPTKRQVEWTAAGIFVVFCIIKRILKR